MIQEHGSLLHSLLPCIVDGKLHRAEMLVPIQHVCRYKVSQYIFNQPVCTLSLTIRPGCMSRRQFPVVAKALSQDLIVCLCQTVSWYILRQSKVNMYMVLEHVSPVSTFL